MIFQHTLEQVLDGSKCQTSRLWQENWIVTYTKEHKNGYDTFDDVLYPISSLKEKYPYYPYRLKYRVGQTLSVQPNRGAKGVARIRILELAKRDVRAFDDSDIKREGFENALSFYRVWYGMHFPEYLKLLDDEYVTSEWWLDAKRGQLPRLNTALVIRFELVKD